MDAAVYLAIVVVLAPVVTYYSVKLVTFAYYRAKHQAEQLNQREDRKWR